MNHNKWNLTIINMDVSKQAYTTLQEMYMARGYTITSLEDGEVHAKVVAPPAKYRMVDMVNLITESNGTDQPAMVQPDSKLVIAKFFMDTSSIKTWLANPRLLKYHIITIVCKNVSSVKKFESFITIVEPYIEVFLEDELFFNITKHVLQPHFERIPKDELKHKMFNRNICPTLSSRDAICRFYRFMVGDMVKIISKDGMIYCKLIK